MKRILLALFCLLTSNVHAGPLSVNLKAKSALLIDAGTGNVIYEKNGYSKQYPASLTKIATTMYALHKAKDQLDVLVKAEFDSIASLSEKERKKSYYTLPAYWLVPGTSHIGIKKDEELTFRDLLYGTMIASGGDAANVVGQFAGGSIPRFVQELNAYLKNIGCINTTFHNPHGLHHPDHTTTAYDLALMTKEAMKDMVFRDIVKTVRYTRPKTNKQDSVTLVQTNRLLKKGKFYYSKAIGVKTGYTSHAKHTLVAAAEHEGRTLIAVLLKYQNRDDIFADAVKLFEEAFKEKKVHRSLIKAGDQKTALNLEHAKSPIIAYTKNELFLDYYPSEKPEIKCFIHWDDVTVPVLKDQKIGEYLVVNKNNETLKKEPLFARESVEPSLFYKIKQYAKEHDRITKWLALFAVLMLFGGLAWELKR